MEFFDRPLRFDVAEVVIAVVLGLWITTWVVRRRDSPFQAMVAGFIVFAALALWLGLYGEVR